MYSVVASRKWAYRSGPLSGLLIWCPVVLSLWDSFEDRVPVDKLHWCPGFDWVAVIWVKDRVPGWQFRVWPPACHYQYKYLYIHTLIFDIHASQYWYPSISVSTIDVHAILLFTYMKFTHYTGSTVHWKRIPWCAALWHRCAHICAILLRGGAWWIVGRVLCGTGVWGRSDLLWQFVLHRPGIKRCEVSESDFYLAKAFKKITLPGIVT